MYSVSELLNKLYQKLNKINEHVESNEKITLIKPHVNRVYQWSEISNFVEICDNINRNPDDFRKYIETELRVKTKKSGEGIVSIRGRYTINDISSMYNQFIEKVVKCKSCRSYNTTLQKSKTIKLKCEACKTTRIITL